MINRRHFKRFTIESAELHSKMHFTEEVQILDVSLGGASISLNHPLTKGDIYALKIDQDGHYFSLNGEVVWLTETTPLLAEDGGNVPVFKAGFCFSKVFTGKGDRLASLIEEKTHSDKQRCRVRGLRVQLDNPKATLDLQDEFKVLEISFGGIQLEASRKLDTDREYRMRMSTPDATKPIQFIGRIASSRPVNGSEPTIYMTGIEFINMGFSDLQKIKDLIYALEHIDPHTPKTNLKTSETVPPPA